MILPQSQCYMACNSRWCLSMHEEYHAAKGTPQQHIHIHMGGGSSSLAHALDKPAAAPAAPRWYRFRQRKTGQLYWTTHEPTPAEAFYWAAKGWDVQGPASGTYRVQP